MQQGIEAWMCDFQMETIVVEIFKGGLDKLRRERSCKHCPPETLGLQILLGRQDLLTMVGGGLPVIPAYADRSEGNFRECLLFVCSFLFFISVLLFSFLVFSIVLFLTPKKS